MKITENDAIKKIFNKKIILGVTAILLAVAFIAVTSFVPFIITKEKLASEEFWTDELIIVAITLFALMATLFVGQASNAQNGRSEIAKAKVRFKESIGRFTDRNGFCQWVKKVLQPKDIQAIKERELRKIGIDDYTVLNLEDAQLKSLAENAQKYNGRYYSQLTKEQVACILDLKDGVKKVKLVEPGYYLTVSSIESDKTTSEKSGREQKVKTAKLVFSVVSKVTLAIIPAIILAALARDLASEGVDKAQAWAKFISRMFALISSAFYGYIIGCQMNDIDADYINMKVDVHELFREDKEFKPLSQQEIAKNDYVARIKKENEEYGKSLGFNG